MLRAKNNFVRKISLLTATAVFVGAVCTSNAFAGASLTEITSTNTYYTTDQYEENHPLGAAAHFHLFVENDVQIGAHTNGNIATNMLSAAGSNAGTSGLIEGEITYIKDFSAMNPKIINSTKSSFVIGPDIEAALTDNNNRVSVKGSTMDYAVDMDQCVQNVYYEVDGGAEYIDMDKEFTYLKNLSKNLAETKVDASYTMWDFFNHNDRVINVDYGDDNCFNVKIDASVLTWSNTELKFKGYDETDPNKSIVVNVDLRGQAWFGAVNVQSKIKLIDSQGNKIGNKERTTWEYGNILWNFYDSSTSNKNFTGAITLQEFMGTVLAPSATVGCYQNLDGTVICSNFANYAETHRNDFKGALPADTKGYTTTSTTTTESTTTESTTETTTKAAISTTEATTKATTTEETTEATTKLTTTEATSVTETTTKTTVATTKVTESTTEATTKTTESTTESKTETTTLGGSGGSDKTTETTTKATTTEATTEATTKATTTEATTEATTKATTTETTTKAVESTTEITSETTTRGRDVDSDATTETSTVEASTAQTTSVEATTETTTVANESTTVNNTEASTESTTETTTETTSEEPVVTDATTESTTETTESTTESTSETTTEEDMVSSGSGISTTVETSTETTSETTTETTTVTAETSTETTTRGHGVDSDNTTATTTETSTETTTVIAETTTETTTRGHGVDSDNTTATTAETSTETTTVTAETSTETTTRGHSVDSDVTTESTTVTASETSSETTTKSNGGGSSTGNEVTTEAETETTTADETESTTVNEENTETTTRGGRGASSTKYDGRGGSASLNKVTNNVNVAEDNYTDDTISANESFVDENSFENTDSFNEFDNADSDDFDVTVDTTSSNDEKAFGTMSGVGNNNASGITAQTEESEKKEQLPQSGSAMDTHTLLGFGALLIVSGLFTLKKKVTR